MKFQTLGSLCALYLAAAVLMQAQKITLTTSMTHAESGAGQATEFVDEQTTAGNPLGGSGGSPTTQWSPGWAGPYSAYIDLGSNYNITTVSLFAGNGGTQSITVSAGVPGTWTPLYTESVSVWHQWYNHSVTANTRYIRLTVPAGNRVAEVVLYGTAVSNVAVTGVTVSPSTASISVGGTSQLTATVAPANATNQNVTWSTSNAAIATVSATGLVSAVAQGSATITATTVDQAKTATSAITVTASGVSAKIALNTGMVSIINGDGVVTRLIDEQTVAGNPRGGSGGTPSTQWNAGYSAEAMNARIDLGTDYVIDGVSLFRGNGGNKVISVAADQYGTWLPLYSVTLSSWNTWYNTPISPTVATRYIRITVPKDSSLNEVVLYGYLHNDVTAPAAISNLAAGLTKSNQVTLSWTSPGDDGANGTAVSYDLRRSTSPINAGNFSAATPVSGVPIPAKAGTTQSFKVTGLNPATTYYFAIKTLDEKPNASAISNVVTKATEAVDSTAPAAITTLTSVTTNSNTAVIKWNASGDDGLTGPSEKYELRRSTSTITAGNFSSATLVAQDLTPYASGQSQSWAVGGLTPNTTYYFAIKAADEVPNWSAISNVLAVTTLAQPSRKSITFDKFMGTHAFVDDPVNLMQATGFIREYHNWNWDEGDIWEYPAGTWHGNINYVPYPNNRLQFAPKYSGNWNFDTFYTSVKGAGLTISPVIQGAAAWLQGRTNFYFHDKPVDVEGASTTVSNNYQAKAHHSFQFAARYGRTFVPDALLTLETDQPRYSGMDLVQYFEDYNEQNKQWEGANAYFSPQEYAAMLSANYDGHARTMKTGTGTFGVKNADPTMKMVMGGLAENGIVPAQDFVDYIAAMKTWFSTNRADGKFAADVINIHHYAFGDSTNGGKSPERDGFEAAVKLVVDYRDANLDPEVEVWVSEFGWDTAGGSPLFAKPNATYTTEEVQGQWILRGYFACAAAGADRAIQFIMRDKNPADPTKFASAGLVGMPGDNYPKKVSWYYVATLKSVLTGTRFLGKVTTGVADTYAYKFKSTANATGVYAVWRGTEGGAAPTSYTLAVPGATTASLVTLDNNTTTGTTTPLTIVSGQVTLSVGEKPVFVKVNSIQ